MIEIDDRVVMLLFILFLGYMLFNRREGFNVGGEEVYSNSNITDPLPDCELSDNDPDSTDWTDSITCKCPDPMKRQREPKDGGYKYRCHNYTKDHPSCDCRERSGNKCVVLHTRDNIYTEPREYCTSNKNQNDCTAEKNTLLEKKYCIW